MMTRIKYHDDSSYVGRNLYFGGAYGIVEKNWGGRGVYTIFLLKYA